jgi:hypothetical protein
MGVADMSWQDSRSDATAGVDENGAELKARLEAAERSLGELRADFNARLVNIVGELRELTQALGELRLAPLAPIEPQPEREPVVAAEREPVFAAEPDPEPEPVVAAEPEAEPEPEPEPVVAQVEPVAASAPLFSTMGAAPSKASEPEFDEILRQEFATYTPEDNPAPPPPKPASDRETSESGGDTDAGGSRGSGNGGDDDFFAR